MDSAKRGAPPLSRSTIKNQILPRIAEDLFRLGRKFVANSLRFAPPLRRFLNILVQATQALKWTDPRANIASGSPSSAALRHNSRGQSGDPSSPHYRDLFEGWARGDYFPLLYSKERIAEATSTRLLLEPGGRK